MNHVKFYSLEELIPESNIVIFSPHYDDVLLGLGGYILGLNANGLRPSKTFYVQLIFSHSNHQVGSGAANYDRSLERIKFATGNRLMEDIECLDELLGEHNYSYELLREKEALLRGKVLADGAMEFPHGMYPEFGKEEWQIFTRLQQIIRSWADHDNTALVFPLAIKEHIDHFITREAAITTANELGSKLMCSIYFQEDKPYAGIQTTEEVERISKFVLTNHLETRLYRTYPEKIIDLAFRHYISQVEDVYRAGVLQRAEELRNLYGIAEPCDCLYAYPK
jgi:hypothetical protein